MQCDNRNGKGKGKGIKVHAVSCYAPKNTQMLELAPSQWLTSQKNSLSAAVCRTSQSQNRCCARPLCDGVKLPLRPTGLM